MGPSLLLRLALVGFGGMIGAILRYSTGEFVSRSVVSRFPVGTLLINAAGCLSIGLLFTLAEDRGFLSQETRLFVGVGILGGFTTFSAFGHETFLLWREGMTAHAALNVVASMIIGVGSVFLGHAIARWISQSS